MEYALGAVRSTDDPRDHPLERYFAVEVLPPKYLPTAYPTVLNQGDQPACVGFSGAVDTCIGVNEAATYDGLDLYQLTKQLDGNTSGGTSIRQCINARLATGAKAISGPVAGLREKITAYARLTTLIDIKTAIVGYRSAWVASTWPNSWFTPAGSVLPPFGGGIAGGHAYEFIGYDDDYPCPDDTRGAFLMQNSWGTGWGTTGRTMFPYSYLDASLIGWEAWRTIPAPLEGIMRDLDQIDEITGTITVAPNDARIAGILLNGLGTVTGITGKTLPVMGKFSLRIPYNSTPNSQVGYLWWSPQGLAIVLARNVVAFVPTTPVSPTGPTSVTISGPVGGQLTAAWNK